AVLRDAGRRADPPHLVDGQPHQGGVAARDVDGTARQVGDSAEMRVGRHVGELVDVPDLDEQPAQHGQGGVALGGGDVVVVGQPDVDLAARGQEGLAVGRRDRAGVLDVLREQEDAPAAAGRDRGARVDLDVVLRVDEVLRGARVLEGGTGGIV